MQCWAEHKKEGGVDPRCETAEMLRSHGVLLERHVVQKAARSIARRGGQRPDQLFANMECHREKQAGVKRSREEYREAQRDK